MSDFKENWATWKPHALFRLSPSALLKSVLSFQAGKVPGSSGKSKEEFLIKKKKNTSGRMQTESQKLFVEILCSSFRFLKQTLLFWKRDIRTNSARIFLSSSGWHVAYCWMHVSRCDTFILHKSLHTRSFLQALWYVAILPSVCMVAQIFWHAPWWVQYKLEAVPWLTAVCQRGRKQSQNGN